MKRQRLILLTLFIFLSLSFIFVSCFQETDWERNYHTHWHKHHKDNWAFHADQHSHPIEEETLSIHIKYYGGTDNRVIEKGHIWFYHGYTDELDKYRQFLNWKTQQNESE